MKVKTTISRILFLVFIINTISGNLIVAVNTPIPKTQKPPIFSWKEDSFSSSVSRVWSGDSRVYNHSDAFDESFVTYSHFFNDSEGTWTKITTTHDYTANYSIFSNTTIQGYLDVNMDLNLFRVDVDYSDVLKLIWFAVKSGNLDMELFTDVYTREYTYVEDYYIDIQQDYLKYDSDTWEIIDAWTEFTNDSGLINTTKSDSFDGSEYYEIQYQFSMPIILTMQIFTSAKKDHIAWANTFWEYLIYDDLDFDSIYSAGESSVPETAGFDLYSSDEFKGFMRPLAWDYHMYSEVIFFNEPQHSHNLTLDYEFPSDKSTVDIADSIVFTPPTMDNSEVSWDISYPNFPIQILTWDDEDTIHSNSGNATYLQTSPGDFNYGFEYNISESMADLDFTLGLSKLNDSVLYDAVQGYGLTIPQYNFFISSFDIQETDSKELTVPSSLFSFESNGTTVAEINMLNPAKVNYTLHDYPQIGTDTNMESLGGSLNRILLDMSELEGNSGNPHINLIYALEEVVEQDSAFDRVDDLYQVETQNYPLWNGESLTHDPTLSVYFEPQSESTVPQDPVAIPGYGVVILLAVLGMYLGRIVFANRKKLYLN